MKARLSNHLHSNHQPNQLRANYNYIYTIIDSSHTSSLSSSSSSSSLSKSTSIVPISRMMKSPFFRPKGVMVECLNSSSFT